MLNWKKLQFWVSCKNPTIVWKAKKKSLTSLLPLTHRRPAKRGQYSSVGWIISQSVRAPSSPEQTIRWMRVGTQVERCTSCTAYGVATADSGYPSWRQATGWASLDTVQSSPHTEYHSWLPWQRTWISPALANALCERRNSTSESEELKDGDFCQLNVINWTEKHISKNFTMWHFILNRVISIEVRRLTILVGTKPHS